MKRWDFTTRSLNGYVTGYEMDTWDTGKYVTYDDAIALARRVAYLTWSPAWGDPLESEINTIIAQALDEYSTAHNLNQYPSQYGDDRANST